MLVALALMGVLASALYASLHTGFRAQRRATAAIGPVRTASLALELVRRDLAAALPPTGILAGSFFGLDETDGSTGADADTLTWHTSVGRPAPGASDIVMMELAVARLEPTGESALVRRVTTNLLAPEVQEPTEEILCRGVVALNLTYFDGSQWLDAWDSGTQSNTLPLAVEALLEVAREPAAHGEEPAPYQLSRVFLLPCGSLPDSEGSRVIGGGSW
jgi:type II secretory pathway pseudopilin PulG